MIWQDIAIMTLCFGLGLAALPSVFSKQKPNKLMCLLYGSIVTGLGVVFATMELWLSLAAELFAALPFWIMLVQNFKMKPRRIGYLDAIHR